MRRACLIILALWGLGTGSAWAATVNYYLDSSVSSSGDGSIGSPWKLLSDINYDTIASAVAAGNQVCVNLKKGKVWWGQLKPLASGVAGRPINFRGYGSGARPLIINGKDNASHNYTAFPAGTAWAATGSNGEYRLDIGSALEFPAATQAVRGQPTGTSTYKRVPLSLAPAGALPADTYTVATSWGHRRIIYKPPAGHTPGEYDWEFSKYPDGTAVFGSAISYITVDGLDFYNSSCTGTNYGLMNFLGSHCTVKHTNIRFAYDFGAMFFGKSSTYNSLEDFDIRYCKASGVHFLANCSHNTLTRGVIAYNAIYSSKTEESVGVDRAPICSLPSSYITISSVSFFGNGCADKTRYYTDLHCDGGDHWTIYGNTFTNTVFGAIACTIADGITPAHHNKIQYNLINGWGLRRGAYHQMMAISVFGKGNTADSGYYRIENNTIYLAVNTGLIGINVQNYQPGDYCQNTSVQNNIVYFKGNTSANSRGVRFRQAFSHYPGLIVDHNDFYGMTNKYECGRPLTLAQMRAAGYSAHDLSADPKFIKAGTDFRLQAGSPCLNNGAANLGLRVDILDQAVPDGPAPEIGAYEYYPPSGTKVLRRR
jgi:hypothetical protein